MNKEEFQNLYKEDLMHALDRSNSLIDKIEALKTLANHISSECDFPNFSIELVDKGYNQYIVTKFQGVYHGNSLISMEYSPDTGLDKFSDFLIYSIKACRVQSILDTVLDDFYDRNGVQVKLWYSLGSSNRLLVEFWDYKNLVVRVPKKLTDTLVEKIESSEDVLKMYISECLNNQTDVYSTLTDLVDSFDNVGINKVFGLKLDRAEFLNQASTGMFNRAEALKVLNKQKSKGISKASIRVVDRLNQLGTFIVAYNITADFGIGRFDVNILDGSILDADNFSIITNGEIVNRIEHILKLSNDEIGIVNS